MRLMTSEMVRWAALIVLLWGCGGGSSGGSTTADTTGGDVAADTTAPEEDTTVAGPQCDKAAAENAPAVTGLIYVDSDESDNSTYDWSYSADFDVPAAGVTVSLLGPGTETQTATCDDGTFAFGGLAEGVYVVAPDLSADAVANTKNLPRRFPDAIREGSLKIVTFGDSVPITGDSPFFPARLAEKLGPLAAVNSQNIAVGGTISDHWLPGTNLFENKLVPQLADADVIIISLGGNDVMMFANSALGNPAGLSDAIAQFEPFVLQIMENVLTIADAIRSHNPDVDIVYCLYPNYAASDMWSSFLGPFKDFVGDLVVTGLNVVRESIDSAEDIILMDLYGATADKDLDLYLYDQLHFNDAGQELYSEEIFKVLGGVQIGETILGQQHNYGLQTLGTP